MNKEITTVDGFYEWKKGEVLWIAKWFKTKEFDCKCSNSDCVTQRISCELISKLEHIREETDSPIRIHSAFRCEKYQKHLRDSGVNTVVAEKSQHELGNAVDISSSKLKAPELYNVCFKYFDSLGKAINFTHIDLRPLKANGKKRLWNY